MGFLKRMFTWWNEATFGTWLYTRLHGIEVGIDEIGNHYYTERNGGRRRWVIYNGEVEASRVPPEWNAWLHHTTDEIPSSKGASHTWQKPHQPNLTGTVDAYHPAGSILARNEQPHAVGDYEPWRPA